MLLVASYSYHKTKQLSCPSWISAACVAWIQGTWYCSLHWQHSTISMPGSSGTLHTQNTWMSSLTFTRVASLRSLSFGNICSFPLSNDSNKYCLIFAWSRTYFPGGMPFMIVVHAIAKSPQSLPPACICTSMICSSILDCLVHKIEAICFFWVRPNRSYCIRGLHYSLLHHQPMPMPIMYDVPSSTHTPFWLASLCQTSLFVDVS